MAGTKIWTVYEIDRPGPILELEARFEQTAIDHAVARTGARREKLYAIPAASLPRASVRPT